MIRLTFVLFLLLLGSTFLHAQTPVPVAEPVELHTMAEVIKAADHILALADEEYLAGLISLSETNRLAGNLDALVAIDAERKRFLAFPQLDESLIVQDPPALVAYQTESLVRFEEASAARHRAVLAGAARLETWLAAQVRVVLASGHLADANRLEEERAAVRTHPAWLDSSHIVSLLPPPKKRSSTGGEESPPLIPHVNWLLYEKPKPNPKGYSWNFEFGDTPLVLDSTKTVALELRSGAEYGAGHSGRALVSTSSRSDAFMRSIGVPSNMPGEESEGANSFTLAAWVWIDYLDCNLGVIHRRGTHSRSFKLEVTPDLYAEFSVYTGEQKSELRAPRPFVSGKWQHLAVTYDFKSRGHSPVRMYLDGDLVASRSDFEGPPNKVRGEGLTVGGSLCTEVTRKTVMRWKMDDLLVLPHVLNNVEIKGLIK